MTTNPAHENAREAARRRNGEFGHQIKNEPTGSLTNKKPDLVDKMLASEAGRAVSGTEMMAVPGTIKGWWGRFKNRSRADDDLAARVSASVPVTPETPRWLLDRDGSLDTAARTCVKATRRALAQSVGVEDASRQLSDMLQADQPHPPYDTLDEVSREHLRVLVRETARQGRIPLALDRRKP